MEVIKLLLTTGSFSAGANSVFSVEKIDVLEIEKKSTNLFSFSSFGIKS